VYVLQGVDADALEILLQAITRKEVDILKSDDILSVPQASSMLQFESIQKICVEMVVHQCLTVSTCLQTIVIADELDLITLHPKAQALALWEFSQAKETDAFLELWKNSLDEGYIYSSRACNTILCKKRNYDLPLPSILL